MQERVRVAVLQMDVVSLNPEANLARLTELMQTAAREGKPDLVVCPELANAGYVRRPDREFGRQYLEADELVPGPFSTGLSKLARQHGVYMVSGISERHPRIPGTIMNSSLLVDPDGRILQVARKVHLAGVEKLYFRAGSGWQVVATDLGNLGQVICLDARYPEPPRILGLQGAEIICCPFNVPKQDPFIADTIRFIACCRATENRYYFIGCNRVGSEHKVVYSGNSAVAAPNGVLLATTTGDAEEILRAELTAADFLGQRALYPYFAGRRPDLYGDLVDPNL